MKMILPKAPPSYDANNEEDMRESLRRADRENIKRGDTIYLVRNEIVIASPNGGLWAIKVDDAGAISTEARS